MYSQEFRASMASDDLNCSNSLYENSFGDSTESFDWTTFLRRSMQQIALVIKRIRDVLTGATSRFIRLFNDGIIQRLAIIFDAKIPARTNEKTAICI